VRRALALVALFSSSRALAADPDPWFGKDKALHFAVTTGVSAGGYGASALFVEDRGLRFAIGAGSAIGLGIAKEIYDAARGGDASPRDLVWDVVGAATGSLVALAIDLLLDEGGAEDAAVLRDEAMTDRAQIQTPDAPAAIGPYSQAVSAGGFIFCSGQIGLDPATGQIVPGGIEPETRRVIANLVAVLSAGGVGPEKVVRTTIYLADLQDFATVNAIYAETFGSAPPARATVQVAALPKGARVEIDAIAMR
jgi:2-iminobutanoate/2-iminopropanoate deaminase